jgi:hypothetical protein
LNDKKQERHWAPHSINFTLRRGVDTLLVNLAAELEMSKAELIRRIVLHWLAWYAGTMAGLDEETRLAPEGWNGEELVR